MFHHKCSFTFLFQRIIYRLLWLGFLYIFTWYNVRTDKYTSIKALYALNSPYQTIIFCMLVWVNLRIYLYFHKVQFFIFTSSCLIISKCPQNNTVIVILITHKSPLSVAYLYNLNFQKLFSDEWKHNIFKLKFTENKVFSV